MKYGFIGLGTIFGFILSRAGATTYDNYANLFLFKNFQLLWVISFAILVGVAGMIYLMRIAPLTLFTKQALSFEKKPLRRGLIFGSLLFGVGWGLAGSCPGTAPAMLGEGKLMALFSILGIGIGTYLYGYQQSRKSE